MTYDWANRAACRDLPDAATIFFPARPEKGEGFDNHGRDAKHLCSTCPVQQQCLVAAVQRGETEGIWGGAGGDQLRRLSRAYRLRQHPPDDHCDHCRWCEALQQFASGERVDRNGPGAVHGRRVTYARGCRCDPCKAAADQIGQASTTNGVSYRLATLAERRCIPTAETA